jgi:hypothetical protein
VQVQSPTQYTRAAAAFQADAVTGESRLTVTVTDLGRLTGPACIVKLDVSRNRIPGLIVESIKDGAYEAELPPGGEATLVAANLRFEGDDRTGVVGVTVDGYERAFLFQTDFSGGTNPQQFTDTSLVINAPRFARPGQPCPVELEVDNPPPGTAKVEFGFDRSGLRRFHTTPFPGVRAQKVGLRLGVPAAGLAFVTEVRDHAFNLNTSGIYGTRALRLSLLDAKNEVLASKEETITLDDSPPESVRFATLPRQLVRGRALPVSASATDRESGLTRAQFFVGEPPAADGKAAPGGRVVTAVPPEENGGEFTAQLPVAEQKGRYTIGVRFTNGVGLTTDKVIEIELVDPPPGSAGAPKPTTGTVKGKIVGGSGDIPQPSIPVQLRDLKGNAVMQAETNDKGEFTFAEVPPGGYVVFGQKIKDNARGEKSAQVTAGKTTEVTVPIRR